MPNVPITRELVSERCPGIVNEFVNYGGGVTEVRLIVRFRGNDTEWIKDIYCQL
jgi:hypothetical protein